MARRPNQGRTEAIRKKLSIRKESQGKQLHAKGKATLSQ
jgi:hypothetical protein